MAEKQSEFTVFIIITIISVAGPLLVFLVAVLITYVSRARQKNVIKKLYEEKQRANGKAGSEGHY